VEKSVPGVSCVWAELEADLAYGELDLTEALSSIGENRASLGVEASGKLNTDEDSCGTLQ
jgi:hypothetical protein